MIRTMQKPPHGTLIPANAVQSGNEARSCRVENGRECSPTVLRWTRSMNQYDTDGDSGDGVECRTCGRDDFETVKGMKIHHAVIHGESIAGIQVECAWCGDTFRRARNQAEEHGRNFCGRDCRAEWTSEAFRGENGPGWKGGKVELTCERCGESYHEDPHREERSSFCSHECHMEGLHEGLRGENNPRWKGGGVELTCEICGDAYHRKPSEADDSRFCSHECYWEHRSQNLSGENSAAWEGGKVELACERCNESYHEDPHRVERSRFCSHECRMEDLHERNRGENHVQWKGGTFPYGEGWAESKKELVRKRDGRECRVCGKSEADHVAEHGRKHAVHHIVKARWLKDSPAELRNGPFNLVTMCSDHHWYWDQLPPLLQFVAFLPHPPLPGEQATLATFDNRGDA